MMQDQNKSQGDDSPSSLVADIRKRELQVRRRSVLLMGLQSAAGLSLLSYAIHWIRVTRDIPEAPLNQRLTFQAWTAFNRGDPKLAIEKSDQCVLTFSKEATELQDSLHSAGIPPPIGPPPNRKSEREISARGPLNDVATCLYIKGRASEALGKREAAIEAYRAVEKYPDARCWDPKG